MSTIENAANNRIVNGHGSYTDPSSRYRDLLEARKVIDAALAVMEATKWSTGAEYDVAEQA